MASFSSPFLAWCRIQQKMLHPDVVIGKRVRESGADGEEGRRGGSLPDDDVIARSSAVSGLLSGAAALSRDGTRLAAHALAVLLVEGEGEGERGGEVVAEEDAAGWLTLPEGHVTLAPTELMEAMEMREEIDELTDGPSLRSLLSDLQTRFGAEQGELLSLAAPALAAVDAGSSPPPQSRATVEQRFLHLARMRYLDRALEAIAEKIE